MFFEDPHLGLLAYALEDVLKTTDKRLRQMRLENESPILSALEVESTLEAVWAEKLQLVESAASTPELLNKLPDLKARILASFNAYTMAPAVQIVPDAKPPLEPTTEERARRHYWPLLEERLRDRYPPATVDKFDRESERVLARLHDPRDRSCAWQTRGLVVGHVQSGKTANYTALICKAADAGYRIFIVLSGIHNDLRHQTQWRLDEEFVGYHLTTDPNTNVEVTERCGIHSSPKYDPTIAPQSATTLDDDFKGSVIAPESRPWLFVIKKNTTVFKRLLRWLKNHVSNREELPLLLIDDEADQASINTKKGGDTATATNSAIRKLLKLFPRASFVGYTATPFANIFINAATETDELGRDLFPKDFILQIPASPNYFGPKQFFGSEDEGALDLFLPFGSESADRWTGKPDEGRTPKSSKPLAGRTSRRRASPRISDDVPAEARTALLQFVLSTAIRLWRKKRTEASAEGDFDDFENVAPVLVESSMLVHVTHLVANQKKVAGQFRDLVEELRDEMRFSGLQTGTIRNELVALWHEQERITPQVRERRASVDLSVDWSLPASFDEVLPLILEVAEDIEVRLVNGETEQEAVLSAMRESFERPRTQSVVFVGGNKLSRGLTLPGLCVSLFLRASTMYDTLLQMGRWFGYRDGYVDLCRIATTVPIIDRFRLIHTAIADFEHQIERMSSANRTPSNYRIHVLSHPGLLVTARNKMRNAAQGTVGYGDYREETRAFDLRCTPGDTTFYDRNTLPALRLYEALKQLGAPAYRDRSFEALYPGEPLLETLPTDSKAKPARPAGRLWKNVPSEDVIAFLRDFSPSGAGLSGGRAALVKQLELMLREGDLTHWTVFIPAAHGTSPLDVTPVRRAGFSADFASDIGLAALKTGGHEYAGLSAELTERVNAEYDESSRKTGTRFDAMREAAGRPDGDPKTGHLILYPIEVTVRSAEHPQGVPLAEGPGSREEPLFAYYMWLPASDRYRAMSATVFNMTVDEYEEEDEVDEEDDPELEGEGTDESADEGADDMAEGLSGAASNTNTNTNANTAPKKETP